MELNLYVEEGDERVENAPTFQYLGRPLDQTDDNWPVAQRKTMSTRSLWRRLGTLLQREGADPKVSASFYRAVVHVILLYGSER